MFSNVKYSIIMLKVKFPAVMKVKKGKKRKIYKGEVIVERHDRQHTEGNMSLARRRIKFYPFLPLK